jgi:hypothetical protein
MWGDMLTELGWTVTRAIPSKFLTGLLTGNLNLYGGVIRDHGGRIVAHLVAPDSGLSGMVSGLGSVANGISGLGLLGSIVNGIQLQALSLDVATVKAATDRILSYSATTAALSGLGLVTSIAGFAFIASGLKRVDQNLGALKKQTAAIKKFLQSQQHAQLMTAADQLRQAPHAPDLETRRQLLMQSKQFFTTLAHHYSIFLNDIDEDSDLSELKAAEAYYVLACIGNVMATSDLDMTDVAHELMRKYYLEWRIIARKHCGKLLLGDNPARLLDSRYVQAMPAAQLIRLLDFVNNTQRGVAWFDDLREALGKTSLFSGSFSRADLSTIEYVNKLLAKNDVLQGFSAHVGFLAEKKMRISSFAEKAGQICKEKGAKWLLLRAG